MKALALALFFVSCNALAASVSVDGLVQTVIYIVIVGLVFWLIWWFIGFCGIPEPFNKVIRVVVALVAVLILINFLLGFVGHPVVSLR